MTSRDDAEKTAELMEGTRMSKSEQLLHAILISVLDLKTDPEIVIQATDTDLDMYERKLEDGKILGELKAAKEIANMYRDARMAGHPDHMAERFRERARTWLLWRGITEGEL